LGSPYFRKSIHFLNTKSSIMILKFTSLNRTALFSTTRWIFALTFLIPLFLIAPEKVIAQTSPVFTVCPGNSMVPLHAGGGTMLLNEFNLGVNATDADGGTVTYAFAPATIDCSNVGGPPISVTVTAIDDGAMGGAPNTTCIFNFTVVDGGPFATCNDISVTLDATGNYTLLPADEMAISMGSTACTGITSIVVTPNTFDCTDIGTPVQVTVIIEDANTATAFCLANVTVMDQAPVATCLAPFNLPLDGTGNATITTVDIDNGSTIGSCGTPALSIDVSTFNCTNVGANTVTLTVSDGNGQSTTCSTVVTIQDNMTPTIMCNPITVELDATGNYALTSTNLSALTLGSSDNCTFTLASSQSAFDCTDIGANTVTITIDDGTNTAMCMTTITVEDNIAPSLSAITGMTTTTSVGGTGNCIGDLTWNHTTVTENCPANITTQTVEYTGATVVAASSFISGASALGTFNTGTTTVTYRVNDGNNPEVTTSFTVTVTDDEAPVITPVTTPPNQTPNNLSGNCFANVGWPTPVTTDNCPGSVSITYSALDEKGNNIVITSNGTTDSGIFPVSLTPTVINFTVTDGAINSSTGSFTVHVLDNEAPIVTCISNQDYAIKTCNAAAEQIPDYRGFIDVADNCSGAYTVTQSPAPGTMTLLSTVPGVTPADGETFTVDITVTDNNPNNLSTSTCSFTVTIIEDDAPEPTIPGAVLPAINEACGIITTFAPTATDACGNNICGEPFPTGVLISNGGVCSGGAATTGPQGSTDTPVTIPDFNFGGVNSIIAISGIDPTHTLEDIVISLDITHSWVSDIDVELIAPDGTSLTLTEDLGGTGDNYIGTTFQDGNPSITTGSPPFVGTFEAIDGSMVTAFNGVTNLNGDWTLNVVDDEEFISGTLDSWSIEVVTSPPAGSVTSYTYPTGNYTVTWIYDDGSGNTSSQLQQVNVSDDVVDPTLTCQDLTLELDENGEASISGNTILGEEMDLGTGSGGANTAEYCVTVASDIDFTFIWQYTQEPDFDDLSFSIDGNSTLLTDPAGPGSQSGDKDISLLTGETFCITLDNDGSVFSNAQIAFLPGLVDDLAIGNWISNGPLATSINPQITDNCGVDFTSILIDGGSIVDFECGDIGTNTVTVTANDINGNEGSCSSTITIEDNLAPANFTVMGGGTLPAGTTVACDAIPANTTMLNAEDNCQGTIPTVFSETTTQSGNPASCADYNFIITRTWTAADNSSNTAAYNQSITVADALAPSNPTYTAAVADNGTINTNPGDCFATITLVLNGLTDCAPFANITVSNNGPVGDGATSASGNYAVGTHTIMYTTTDVCGNSSTHNYTFTVQDGLPPIASCVNSLNIGLPSTGILILQPFAVDNNSFDNCTAQGDLTLSITPDTFTCAHVGMTIEVELTVEDEGGLTSSCTTTITIQDNNDPTAVCQPINVALDANGMVTISAADVDGGSSDDCALAASPFAVTPSSFTEANIGTNVVTFTVTDAQGNTDSCTTTVTIDYPPTCFAFGGPSAGNGVVFGGQGDIVEFPVHVTDFTNVNSFQFTMNIDVADVGEFIDVSSTNPVLDPASGGSFFYSLVQTDSVIDMVDTIFVPDQMGMDSIASIDTTYSGLFDQISVNWQNPTPQAIADDEIAFTVSILLTGNLNDDSPINPTTGVNGNNPQISYSYNNVTSPVLTPCFEDTPSQGFILVRNVVVAGEVYDEGGAPANAVNVELYELPDIVTPGDMFTTIADGAYSFDVNNSPGNYTVRPYKYINWPNGVTTADVSDIQRHAIGVANFDFGSSYKEIAADINNDLQVSTFDALLLNQYVASAYTLPPPAGIPSWRFVPAAQQFTYSSNINVEPYDTTITFMNLIADTLANNFIAIKMGDVNGDSNPQSLTNESADPFDDNNVHFQIKDQSFQAGDLVTVEMTADQFNELRAYQWILQFDKNVLNFADVQMGTLPALGMKNFGLNLLEEGKIVMTWFTTQTESKLSDEVLYSFTFEASRDGQLSQLLTIGQVEHFRSEAYGIANGDNRNIDLRFTDKGQELVANFALMQNSPNPFKDQTSIGFYLPEAATATLSLMDVSGRLLKTIEIEATKGYNAITINKDELLAAGMVHYQLETPTHSAVKKMVILN
jgi:subtilisin-like proprotein convertase family protein